LRFVNFFYKECHVTLLPSKMQISTARLYSVIYATEWQLAAATNTGIYLHKHWSRLSTKQDQA